MATFLWLIVAVFYGLTSFKTTGWQSIKRLGFGSECPEGYLKRPHIHHFASIALFLASILIPILASGIPWWLSVLIVIESIVISITAREQSLKNYRKILQEMVAQAESVEEKESYLAELKKSDMAIWNEKKGSAIL